MFTSLIEKEKNLKKAQEYAISRDGECISEKYINSKIKVEVLPRAYLGKSLW